MVRALEAVLGRAMNVSPDGHYMGGIGAALFALERAEVSAAERAGAAREPASSRAGAAREPACATGA